MWFDESLRFRLCTATFSGWFNWMKPCTASPTNPTEIPAAITTFSGWKDPTQR